MCIIYRDQQRTPAGGVLVVDKPAGITSFKMVSKVKRLVKAKKAGHTGTLDPFATGVLPICINQATKAAQFFLEGEKEYVAVMCLGVETDTLDISGTVTSRSEAIPTEMKMICDVGLSFVGTILQQPPAFSAVKVNGAPLYVSARKGIPVNAPVRSVEVYQNEVLAIDGAHVTFHVKCSKGTYIRTLASDWGKKMNCGAHLVKLRRLRSGPFTIEQAVDRKELAADTGGAKILERLIPVNSALGDWPELVVDAKTAQMVRNGRQINDMFRTTLAELDKNRNIRLVTEEKELIALMKPIFDDQRRVVSGLKYLRVFNLN